MPKVDKTLAQLEGPALFSYQWLLADPASWGVLLTVNTCEVPLQQVSLWQFHYPKWLSKVLEKLDGVVYQVNDGCPLSWKEPSWIWCPSYCCFGADWEDRSDPQQKILRKRWVKFLGHVINAEKIRADSQKTTALQWMSPLRLSQKFTNSWE